MKEKRGTYLTTYNVGIFSTSLLAAVAATYIYSPVIGVNAATNANVDVNASVNPIASISIDNPSLNFNIVPTASGYFDSKTVTATVDTNSTGGYELYFSSEDNNTAMTHSDSNISNTIASDFSGSVTSSSMAANKWGYSLDGTNYSKIPAANAQATIKNIDHYPSSAEKTNTVRIGMKLNSDLPSGTYTKNVTFSVLAHETPKITLSSISNMQDITSDICSDSSLNETNTLTDTRDGNTYIVKKLADNRCWMTQNLRIAGKTITPADSNVTSDFTIPASNLSSFTTSYDTNSAYLNSTYGGYYSFYTATAGTGGTSLTTDYTNIPSSICPKGWKMPTNKSADGTLGEIETLYINYKSPTMMQGDPGFVLSGAVSDGSMIRQGEYGFYWLSTNKDTNNAYRLEVGTTSVGLGSTTSVYGDLNYDYKLAGFAVRCVAI